jgi:glycerol-3-phosphate dehydrogenase
VRSSGTRNTAKLSRGHTVEVGRSGLVTITGGKWTTYRRMAEDAVDHAVSFAGLSGRASRTKDLIIDATGPARIDDASLKLHPDLPYTRPDIVRAVRGEMARTVEDVLARRTRALFLNARAALEIAPAAAAIMADEMGKPPEWVDGQLEDFREIAKNYMVNSRMGAGSFTECD